MPVYAYACKDCGHAFDIRQSFTDDALTVCPECGGHLRKKFNSVGVVFKGSGFYRTDSRSESALGPDASSGSGSGSAGSSESSGTSGAASSGGSDGKASGSAPSGGNGSGAGSASSGSGTSSAGSATGSQGS